MRGHAIAGLITAFVQAFDDAQYIPNKSARLIWSCSGYSWPDADGGNLSFRDDKGLDHDSHLSEEDLDFLCGNYIAPQGSYQRIHYDRTENTFWLEPILAFVVGPSGILRFVCRRS